MHRKLCRFAAGRSAVRRIPAAGAESDARGALPSRFPAKDDKTIEDTNLD